MRRILVAVFLLIFACGALATQKKGKKGGRKSGKTSIECPAKGKLTDITKCPLTGCGNVDPLLNEQKNIRSDDQTPAPMTLQDMKDLPDPVEGFAIGEPRDKLKEVGEGKRITVVAYALVARKGGKESCNCGLSKPADTDNHIVLVDEKTLAIKKKATRAKPATDTSKAVPAKTAQQNTLAAREEESETAEFTPRVRLDHPNLAGARLQKLIAAAPEQALQVRVTGQLMFDSEHSLGHHLKRVNNWEIHPVMKLEYCPEGQTCTADSDNWTDLETED